MPRSTEKDSRVPQPPRSLRARVRGFILDNGLLSRGDAVLAGVSGGPDSTCLLVTLASLRASLGFDLHAAHFDHRLRGPRAAAREERFVRSLAERLGVPLRCGGGDVRAHARKRSLEEAARELRYRFLAKAASEVGCGFVAVGHTRDDQAETLLLHIIRGSGLRGLAAMAPSSPWPLTDRKKGAKPPRLVRPLLGLTRQDTESCCRAAGLAPLADPSNRSRRHLRNRVREELLPLLRRYNVRIDDALVRLSSAASVDVELLESMAAEALAGQPEGQGSLGLSRRRLAEMAPALQRHAVRLAAARVMGDARGLSDRHVHAVLRAAEGPTGSRLDLPRGLQVHVARDDVVFATGPAAAPLPLPDGEFALAVPGVTRFGPWRFDVEVLAQAPPDVSSHDADTAYLDSEACGGRIWLRRRRRGDRFQPLGLSRPKKLQDFFVDAHVPRGERDSVPLVCGERGIAWVVGQRPAEWAKVTPASRRVLALRGAQQHS